jgi:hypothetical protein
MSTARKSKTPSEDPFRYGWRYVWRTTPDGGREQVEVSLTIGYVLPPEEENLIATATNTANRTS